MNKSKKYTILCADLETQMCAGCEEYNHEEPEVWLSGYKELYTGTGSNFTNIEDMYYHIIDNVENPLLYFHYGGKFDTFYVFDLLISKLGFTPINKDIKLKDIKPKDRKHFSHVSSNGTNYDITIYDGKKKLIIRDSYRLIPLSIEKLGGKTEGKFNDKAKYGHMKLNNINELAEQDLKKFNEDIDTMRINLQAELFYGKEAGMKEALPMTMASLGIKDQKEHSTFFKYNLYNKLTLEQWDYFINFFRGGIVWANPKFLEKQIRGEIRHYDVNSLYPTILKNELLPFGTPLTHKPEFGTFVTTYQIFIREAKLKEGKIPYIGLYDKSYSEKDWEKLPTDYAALIDDASYSYPEHIYNLTYHVFDFELEWIKEQYDIDFTIQKTHYFQTKQYFKTWVEAKEALKMLYTQTGDKVNRNSVKLIMNSGGFGKYGQKRKNRVNVFKYISEEERKELRKNAIVYKAANQEGYYYFASEQEEEINVYKLKYCPLAAFVTAKARIYISKFRQEYFQWFIYGDTDDMYLLDKEINIDYLDIKPNPDGTTREGQFGLFSYEPEEDYWQEMFVHGSKKYWVGRKAVNGLSAKHIIKFAGFIIKPELHKGLTFNEFCKLDRLKDAKTFKEYSNGKPIISNKDGILHKKKK